MECPYCKVENRDGVRYCSNCGRVIDPIHGARIRREASLEDCVNFVEQAMKESAALSCVSQGMTAERLFDADVVALHKLMIEANEQVYLQKANNYLSPRFHWFGLVDLAGKLDRNETPERAVPPAGMT